MTNCGRSTRRKWKKNPGINCSRFWITCKLLIFHSPTEPPSFVQNKCNCSARKAISIQIAPENNSVIAIAPCWKKFRANRKDSFVPKYHWFSHRREICAQPITFERAITRFPDFRKLVVLLSARASQTGKFPRFPLYFFRQKFRPEFPKSGRAHFSPTVLWPAKRGQKAGERSRNFFPHSRKLFRFFTSEKGRKKSERTHFRHFSASRPSLCRRAFCTRNVCTWTLQELIIVYNVVIWYVDALFAVRREGSPKIC